MRRLGQLLLISMVAIILAPAVITVLLGNNEIGEYNPIAQVQQVNSEEDKVLQERIIGIVAKEIPITYEIEALKAQAIIVRSQSQSPQHITKEEMKQLWGGDYNKNYSKIRRAVEETQGMVITYDNQPVQVAYHMLNPGFTQSSRDIWGVETPYLQEVESSWDAKSPDLINEKVYAIEEVIEKLTNEYPDLILEPYSLETQIQIIERTKTGYVKEIQVGNKLMSGDTFRRILNLKSGCLALKYENTNIRFITKGVGHGVGLSQYGANEMAKEGKSYNEILKHYFPDVDIKTLN